jgi:WD40 repeat protein
VGNNYYQVGGSLPYSASNYIVRQADTILYDNLKGGHFCYVLNSRQMGKSSLLLRTMSRLQEEGFHCVTIDLSEIGNRGITAKEWYGGIVYKLATQLNILTSTELNNWFKENSELSPVQRLSVFIENIVLKKTSEKIVIFIDEIDSVLSLKFSGDDFFILIRAFYNKRAENPDYERLIFAIFGVATPSDLVKDTKRTPFNIGHSIELTGFQLNEVSALTLGISEICDNVQEVLQQILVWTGGQPFLTQKLCQLILNAADYIPAGQEAEYIEQIVQQKIIDNWEAKDEPRHLRTIRDRLLYNEQFIGRILGLYKQILQLREIPIYESEEQIELKLSGLVVRNLEQSKLVVNNPIYQTIFNQKWVDSILLELRPYGTEIKAWVDSKLQDESMLLRGQLLKKALDWAESHKLSDEDYQFLTASQELENTAVQKNLDIEKKARFKKVRQLNTSLIALFIGVTTASIVIISQSLSIKEANDFLKVNQQGYQALRTFESQNNQIKSLITAIKSGQELKSLASNINSLQNYPAMNPLLSLQTILDKIQQKNILGQHNGNVWSLSFSPNGNLLATVGEDDYLILWNQNGQLIKTIKSYHTGIYSVQFSPDGQIIATAGKDKLIRLWNLSGTLRATLKGHTGEVYSVSFNPKNNYIATAGADDTVRIWDFHGKQIHRFQYPPGLVRRVSFSPDGKFFATSGIDDLVRLWDLSNKEIAEFKTSQNSFFNTNFIFIPNTEYILTISSKSKVKLWKYLSPQKPIAEFNTYQGDINSVNVSNNGQYLATAGSDGTIQTWTLSGDKIDEYRLTSSLINYIVFSPEKPISDSKYRLAIAGTDGIVQIIYLRSQYIYKYPSEKPAIFSNPEKFSIASFSHNLKFLVTTANLNSIKIFNQDTKVMVGSLINKDNSIRAININNSGQQLLTIHPNGTIKIWQISGQKFVESLTLPRDQDNFVTANFTPDSQQVVTGNDKGEIKFWDLSGKLTLQKKAHQGKIKSMTFNPDGTQLATLGEDDKIKIWNRDGNLITEFDSPQNNVNIIRFNTDGKILAVVGKKGDDNQINLLVVSGNSAGQSLAELIVNDIGIDIFDVGFLSRPEGEYIVTASSDNTVKLWRIENLDELLTRGCKWLQEYLVTNPAVKDELKFCHNSM